MRLRTCVLDHLLPVPVIEVKYSQFAPAMDTLPAPTDQNTIETHVKNGKNQTEQLEKTQAAEESHRFEGKVTAEQELSASVARKRRNISKKRSESAHRPRDVTPARDLQPEQPNTDETQPKTPERKVKKTNSDSSSKSGNDEIINKDASTNTAKIIIPPKENEKETTEIIDNKEKEEIESKKEKEQPKTPSRKVRKTSSASSNKSDNKDTESKPEKVTNNLPETTINKKEEQQPKKDDDVKVTSELQSLLDKAKTASAAPREKPARMKRDKILKKRSQSTPRPSTEEDYTGSREDLEEKKIKLKREKEFVDSRNYEINTEIKTASKDLIEDFKQAQILCAKLEISPVSSSESSTETTNSSDGKIRRRTQYTPAAQQFLERRKLERALSAEESKPPKPEAKKKRMTFKELRSYWSTFKLEHSEECEKIRDLRNRCLNDVSLLLIFCGIGGIIFKFTEGAFENFYKCGVKRVKRDFIDFLWLRSHNLREDDWKTLARTKLRDFEEQLHTAHEAGVHSYSGQRSWSFLNGIVYCLTVVTTIGKQLVCLRYFFEYM